MLAVKCFKRFLCALFMLLIIRILTLNTILVKKKKVKLIKIKIALERAISIRFKCIWTPVTTVNDFENTSVANFSVV